ncbi:MAG: recombinase family protein [Bacteroidetes bacterium]|nr:recombinase family protein [Bacteroidota bacterium]
MKEKLQNGGWIGQLPKGYSYAHKRGEEQRIIINDEGKLLKKAFQWKAEQNMPHPLIVKKLNDLGLRIPIQLLTDMFRNPFYAGMVANRMLEGEIVKGKHPAMITTEQFLKINKKLATNGYKSNRYNESLPLKQFVKCADCGTPFTGYLVRKKNLYYYKCNKAGCKCNKSQKELHSKFVKVLSQFQWDQSLIEPLKLQLLYTYENMTARKTENQSLLNQSLNDLKKKMENIEERHAIGDINRTVYEKYTQKYQNEIDKIENELPKEKQKLSNPEKLIEFAVNISSKINTVWESSHYTQKLNLQKMIFPEGILFDRKNNDYRTGRVNWLFSVIDSFSGSYDENKNGTIDFFHDKSRLVARSGVEPETSGL